jgi:hypothetical protein
MSVKPIGMVALCHELRGLAVSLTQPLPRRFAPRRSASGAARASALMVASLRRGLAAAATQEVGGAVRRRPPLQRPLVAGRHGESWPHPRPKTTKLNHDDQPMGNKPGQEARILSSTIAAQSQDGGPRTCRSWRSVAGTGLARLRFAPRLRWGWRLTRAAMQSVFAAATGQ